MGESSLMERGGDKGGEGGTRSKSAGTNNSKIPPPSTHSGNGSYLISVIVHKFKQTQPRCVETCTEHCSTDDGTLLVLFYVIHYIH